jgi:DNA-binding NarL/FixJ family response regulator
MTRILTVDSKRASRVSDVFQNEDRLGRLWRSRNGAAAVELARNLKPDVVVLDYPMPVMNGLEAARAISVLAPGCAILMYTMFAAPDLSALASVAGVRVVLSKKVNGIGAVMETIEAVASGKSESLGATG